MTQTNTNTMAKLGGEKAVTVAVKRKVWKELYKLHIDRDDDDNLSDTIAYLLSLYKNSKDFNNIVHAHNHDSRHG